MTIFFTSAFAAGLVLLAWIAAGFAGSSWPALLMTALIAAAYLAGARELWLFRRATAALQGALDAATQPPSSLAEWLERVPAALRNAVRLRLEGERVGLPGPALTPYLVGLLVMLGMLGTFLGMIVTFRGAVFALDGSTDLQAIRAALAVPLQGLGLSFGTSVAGVGASAMLGLMSAIARRERLDIARLLEQRIAGPLHGFSAAHRRQESFGLLQSQARALPQVAEQLQALMERIEARSRQLDEQLLERHAQLQRDVSLACTTLAHNVGRALQENLAAGARAAGDALRPVAEETMAQILAQAQQTHERLGEVAQAQVDAVAGRFDTGFARVLDQHQDLVASLRQDEERRAASAREQERQAAQREQHALQEQAALLERLQSVLQGVEQGTARQGEATEALVASAGSVLQQAGERFVAAIEAQSAKAADTSVHLAAGAVELAAVAEAFGESVAALQASHDKLAAGLDRMEASLRKSTSRSDEQLAYYVAQAREVIDLSIASQQGLVEKLQQLHAPDARTPVLAAAGAAR